MASALRVGIIGVGRVGSALGRALQNAGHSIAYATAISQSTHNRVASYFPATDIAPADVVVANSDLVLIAVPDDVMPQLVSGLAATVGFRPGQIVLHTSGRFGLDVLAPASVQGALCIAAHPAMTFVGAESDVLRLNACPFAITARDEAAAIAQALVLEMGGEPQFISEEDRVRYHAALAHASNHLTTVIAQSENMLRDIGVSDPASFITPLVMASAENALQRGAQALTGPISRGDVETIRAHIDQIPLGKARDTYVALARATVETAVSAKKITAEKAAEILAVLV
jgi:predicted short-subunit dehydrogenase-like oxidoreductase (DUF2520 family)